MLRPLPLLVVAGAAWAALAVALASTPPRPGVWFAGDFENGLAGWAGDLARPQSAVVVTAPVRRGRHAIRITLAPGDKAASKERAELKLADKEIERVRGKQGGDLWYGWSLLVPADYADPPGDQFQILGQWHQRPTAPTPGARPRLDGPPPLAIYLVQDHGRPVLLLIAQPTSHAPPRRLGGRPIRRGTWTDLVVHLHASTGRDGFVEAWLDGQPWTGGKKFGPTLYTPVSNYLRLGLYRGKGVPTVNTVYYDEVRLGSSYRAVAP